MRCSGASSREEAATRRREVFMSTREVALSIFNQLTEEQLHGFVSMFGGFYGISEEYNEETEAAMKSAYNNEDIIGPFNSVSELMEALNA